MKIRIALTVLTIVVLIVTGCTSQPGAQKIQISAYNSDFADFGTVSVDESYGSLAKYGYNESQNRQMLIVLAAGYTSSVYANG